MLEIQVFQAACFEPIFRSKKRGDLRQEKAKLEQQVVRSQPRFFIRPQWSNVPEKLAGGSPQETPQRGRNLVADIAMGERYRWH